MTLLLLAACDPPTPRTYPVFEDTSVDDTDDTGNTDNTGDTSDTGTDTGVDPPDAVSIDFQGRVASITGTPFGFDGAVVNATVSGFFTYDRAVDDSVTDPLIGEFDHRDGSGPFTIVIDGPSTVFVAGSTNPLVAIDVASDTFEWKDGPQPGDGGFDRFCTVDGVENDEVQIDLSFVPAIAQTAFDDDTLPATFPYVSWDLSTEATVVFTVEDGADSMVITLITVTQP